ncbi:MAG: hypothetical protein HY907_18340 [Deltaproteobacteria bacterium]|nr:hypothetical protein [Deltaproteobacteria bacterium]
MRASCGIAVLVVALAWPVRAHAQLGAEDPVPSLAAGPTDGAPIEDESAAVDLEPAAESSTAADEAGSPPSPVPPGQCTLPASHAIEVALARSDAGDVAADLELAACWRLLEQSYPERVALARALARGLPDEVVAAVRARLDELGGPPPVSPPQEPATNDSSVQPTLSDQPTPSDQPTLSDQPAPIVPYALGGLSLAGLLGGTALGLAALYEHSRAAAEVVDTSLDEDLGIAAGVCAGVGIAAGVAALILWPDGETGPTAGPGDVGLGWEVRF